MEDIIIKGLKFNCSVCDDRFHCITSKRDDRINQINKLKRSSTAQDIIDIMTGNYWALLKWTGLDSATTRYFKMGQYIGSKRYDWQKVFALEFFRAVEKCVITCEKN